jgi:hypothetical protein
MNTCQTCTTQGTCRHLSNLPLTLYCSQAFLESYLPTLIFEPEESAFEHHDDIDRDGDMHD